jgi:hypothetical protein
MYSFNLENLVNLPQIPIFYSFTSVPIFSALPCFSSTIPTLINLDCNSANSQTLHSCSQYSPLKKDLSESEQNQEYDEKIRKNKGSNEQKMMRPKKNVESNISNQVFSYIANEHKSRVTLTKVLK